MSELREDYKKALREAQEKYDADYITYFGELKRPYDDEIIRLVAEKRSRSSVVLHLITYGGDPHVAYRIAREIQANYSNAHNGSGRFYLFVNGVCASAGTLLALGADEIIMNQHAELGPLDVQLRKPDEVGERTSGLTPIESLEFLKINSIKLFRETFFNLRFDPELAFSTRMAADISAQLSTGMMGKIYQQMDPIRLGEIHRSIRIAEDYGERLGRSNIKEGTIGKLITGYPSHSCVIDKREAEDLFDSVSTPSPALISIGDALNELSKTYLRPENCFVQFLTESFFDELLPDPKRTPSAKDVENEDQPAKQQESDGEDENL